MLSSTIIMQTLLSEHYPNKNKFILLTEK